MSKEERKQVTFDEYRAMLRNEIILSLDAGKETALKNFDDIASRLAQSIEYTNSLKEVKEAPKPIEPKVKKDKSRNKPVEKKITMTQLSDAWDKFKKIEYQGTRTTQAREAEKEINNILLGKNEPAYDFDARWLKNASMAQSSIDGPPSPIAPIPEDDEIKPQGNFTLEEAKDIIGDNTYSMLVSANKYIEAMLICSEYISKQTNPINQTDKARCLQSVSLTIGKYYKDKNNG